MTTWLPAICGLWVALCATVFAIDPLFRGHDRTFGWVLGITVGSSPGRCCMWA